MDKKSKYSQSTTSKGTGSGGDAKKNQDVVSGGKVFPKTARRRESSGPSGYTKNEQPSKKTNIQKARSFDKRPKPKGQYHGGAKEDTKVEDEEAAEPGSVMVPGSKKQNLNHLLNFHYAPRDAFNNSGSWNYGRPHANYNNNNDRWLPPVQRHKYNKEQFLQANCQFVVGSSGDYKNYLNDPDTLVDWNLIEQIRLRSSESLSCPICLCPPVAGKMTRCGHVYCWPCILHYLALSDKTWRKCPICYESVHKADLKSVVEVTQNHLNVGDRAKLRLMRRERGSLIAVPVYDGETTIPSTFITVSEAATREIYSKLLLADVTDVADIIESERIQLKLELLEDPHSPENCFVEQALTDLSTREERISCMDAKCNIENSIGNEPKEVLDESTEIQYELENKSPSNESGDVVERNSVSSNPPTNRDEGEETAVGNAESLVELRALPKFFYFYQVEDGQHMYLHAMNVKMLELQYGALENCPRTIFGKILEKEAGSFTEELRRRMRYLHHLPLTCPFEIAEIDLDSSFVNDEIRSHFAEQIENREKRRRKRERDERMREKKITAEENKRMGKFAGPKVHIESRKHFPRWQPESPSTGINIPSPAESLATSSAASSPSRSSFLDDNSSLTSDNSQPPQSNFVESVGGLSFAQMLQNKGTRAGFNSVAWPSIGAAEPSRNRSAGVISTSADIEEDAYASAPSYNQSFCDDLAQSLNDTNIISDADKNQRKVNSSGKKKKKCKATVLFATSMSRAS